VTAWPVRFEGARLPGGYKLTTATGRTHYFAVPPDPREGDLTPLDTADRETLKPVVRHDRLCFQSGGTSRSARPRPGAARVLRPAVRRGDRAARRPSCGTLAGSRCGARHDASISFGSPGVVATVRFLPGVLPRPRPDRIDRRNRCTGGALYRAESRRLSRRKAALLFALRIVAASTVFLIWATNPVVVRSVSEPQPGRVLVAVDLSDSSG